MLNNFRNLQSLFGSHGSRWLFFRVGYALRKRTGYIRLQMPAYQWKDRPLETWLRKNIPSTPPAYVEWRKQNAPKFFFDLPHLMMSDSKASLTREVETLRSRSGNHGHIPWNLQSAVHEAERILSGELKYFARTYHRIGFPPNWHTDPVTGTKLDAQKHWSEIADDGNVDIKFIWDASRFSMVYTLVRAYASTRDEKFAEAFWELIQAWAESNPPNTGPNWMDGQEAALRLMAWTFGFHAFMDSPSTTPERVAQFVMMVAAHAERIHKNIDYAISTHSNHTISEACGLWLVGLLFPELKDSETYLSLGRKLLEQEAAAQIFPDGTYSMYSLNYHRFVLHIYLYVIRLAELNQSPISSLVFDRVSASIDYLSQLIDPDTGNMPGYGSNDGALILPLNNCDFTDYRPLLQLGAYITKKEFLFEPGPWDEDVFWLCGDRVLPRAERRERSDRSRSWMMEKSQSSFPFGGTYLLRGTSSKAIIRCTDFRSRPSHADQLHVALWLRGRNIACDAGTYLYSGDGVWRNGLARTAVHNTVTVDRQDQMKMVSRFTWTNWARGNVLHHDENIWQGEHAGYRRLADPVTHRRAVLSLDNDRWLVVDHLAAAQSHQYALHWLLNDFPFVQTGNSILLAVDDSAKYKIQLGLLEGKSAFSVVRGDENSTRGWRSQYYGEKQPAISALLETDQPRACFWTFFGFESDTVEILGKMLNISSGIWNVKINLDELRKAGHAWSR
ncbi:MAG: alginate lyase family protein [Chloroflexota bacterium]